jgi:hypothetical protein
METSEIFPVPVTSHLLRERENTWRNCDELSNARATRGDIQLPIGFLIAI